ncbi:MAG: acetyl-CoA carboxylase carboxyltransferase subunit beta [Kiritimatiellae bacterium]|nr:acetyl-CoA carboxylase carboxyltransferase subunit beta [Kiritimatiellia bacterium]
MAWFELQEKKTKIPGAKALWTVCGRCRKYVPNAEWKKNSSVCPECGYHGRISARERIALLADEGTFEELFADVGYSDHLNFHDASGAYVDKVEAARKKTGEGESVITGKAAMEGIGVVLGAMDFAFMGGSLGTGTGEKITRAAELALAERRPFILACASGGARMQEGIRSLMQMVKTSAAIGRLKEAGIPYVSILTDPTTGGVSASYAMLGDINIAEPKVLIGFAGRRVIENTIHQKLPDDFQTAEYLLEHGFVDRIVPRNEMKSFIVKMLNYFGF